MTLPLRPFCPIRGVALAAVLACGGCLSLRPATVPMRVVRLPGGSVGSRCAIVFLPGRWDRPADFTARGFSQDFASRGVQAELVAPDAHLAYYVGGTLVERLEQDVIRPLRSTGHDRIWIVGVSMGGLGALLTLRAHPDDVTGVVALAPFLGDGKITKEITAAGGLAHWDAADPGTGDYQRELWAWLKEITEPGAVTPPIWLAYGDRDKLAAADSQLAAHLPADQVLTTSGAHDWSTWGRLWQAFLAGGTLDRECGGGRDRGGAGNAEQHTPHGQRGTIRERGVWPVEPYGASGLRGASVR